MSDKWDTIAVDGQSITYEKEGWVVECSWPTSGRQYELWVEMRIHFNGIGGGLVMSKQRVNVKSGSSSGKVLTAMNKWLATPDEKKAMHADFQRVLESINWWYENDNQVDMPDPNVVEENPSWLLYPLWPATGITGVAAAPGSFKSYMTQLIALSLHYGTPLLTRNTRVREPKRILYLDWEDEPDEFARRLRALQKANGIEVEPVLAYKKMTAGLSDRAHVIQKMVLDGEFDGVIIDSMSASVNGDMNNNEVVNAFWDAVHLLGVPTLVLAHKSVANQQNRQARFFGTGMSEARVRYAWNAEATEDRNFVVWENFKDNRYGKKGSKLAWEVEFTTRGQDEDETLEGVTFLGVNPDSVLFEENGGGGSKDPAWHELFYLLLERGPLESREIEELLGVPGPTVRSWLKRSDGALERVEGGKIAAVAGKVQR